MEQQEQFESSPESFVPKRYEHLYHDLKTVDRITGITFPEQKTQVEEHFRELQDEYDLPYAEKIFAAGIVAYLDAPTIDVDFKDGDDESEDQRREWETELSIKHPEAALLYWKNRLKLANIRNALQAALELPGVSEKNQNRSRELFDTIYGREEESTDYRRWTDREKKKELVQNVAELAHDVYREYVASKTRR